MERTAEEKLAMMDCTDRATEFLRKIRLTHKETLVAWAILRGLSGKEMSAELGNTEKTIKHHIRAVMIKAGVTTRLSFLAAVFPVGAKCPPELLERAPVVPIEEAPLPSYSEPALERRNKFLQARG